MGGRDKRWCGRLTGTRTGERGAREAILNCGEEATFPWDSTSNGNIRCSARYPPSHPPLSLSSSKFHEHSGINQLSPSFESLDASRELRWVLIGFLSQKFQGLSSSPILSPSLSMFFWCLGEKWRFSCYGFGLIWIGLQGLGSRDSGEGDLIEFCHGELGVVQGQPSWTRIGPLVELFHRVQLHY